jgi:hypothetical protein
MRILTLCLATIITLQLSTDLSVRVQAAGTRAGRQAIHACSLVSEADLQRITGTTNRPTSPPSRTETPNGATQCNYVGLNIALTPGVNAQNFQANRQSAAQQRGTVTEPLAGVGEEAYYFVRARTSSSQVGVVFRVGTHQVALGDSIPSASVDQFKPKLVELAKVAAAKLR